MIFHYMTQGFCRCDAWLIPHQPIVAIIAGPLNPPILGDFEAFLARKSPRIGGLGGGSAGFVASFFGFG